AANRGGVRGTRADPARVEGRLPRSARSPLGLGRRATPAGSGFTGVRRARARPGAGHRPPPRALLSFVVSGLGTQLKRLGKHSVIYGLGGLVSRILAVLLLPLYTRYLSPSDYGKVE